MAKEMRCPNCLEKVTVKADGSVVCASCGGTFRWQEGEAKLAGAGEFEKLTGQVAELKARVDELAPETPADAVDQADQTGDDQEGEL